MSQLDPRDVLNCLNELGYQNITAKQLQEFMKDLKKLIKYERKRTQSQENEQELPPTRQDIETGTPYNKSIHTVYRSAEQNSTSTDQSCRPCSPTWCQACIHSFNQGFNYGHYHKRHESCKVPDRRNANESIAPKAKTNISQHRIFQHAHKENEKENIPVIEVQDILQSLELEEVELEVVEPSQPITIEIKRSGSGDPLDLKELQRQSQQSIKSRPLSERPKSKNNNRERGNTPTISSRCKVRRSKSYIIRKSPMKIARSDPVALYQKYKREWRKHKLPGEDNRLPERWAIRERLIGDTQRMKRSPSLEVACSQTRQNIHSKDDKASKQERNVKLTKERLSNYMLNCNFK